MRNQWDIVKEAGKWRLAWRENMGTSDIFLGPSEDNPEIVNKALEEMLGLSWNSDDYVVTPRRDVGRWMDDFGFYWEKRDQASRFRAVLNKRIRELEGEKNQPARTLHSEPPPKGKAYTILICPNCGAALQVVASHEVEK